MGKRHENLWLNTFDNSDLDLKIKTEQQFGLNTYGHYSSAHELAAVLREEFEEFWETVRNNDPDPKELLQICAVARRGIVELCATARKEIKDKINLSKKENNN